MPELPNRLAEAPVVGSDPDAARSATGPLRVAAWIPGQRLELESWTEHWATTGPARKITFVVERQMADRFARLQRGEADIVAGLDPHDWSAAKSGPATEETAARGPRVIYLGIIPRDATSPLARPEVRQALSGALALDDIGNRVYAGQLAAARELMPVLENSGPPPVADTDGARARLAQLGAGGATVELVAAEGRLIHDSALADEIERALVMAGFQVQRTRVDWAQLSSGLTAGPLDRVYLGAWENRVFDPTLGFEEFVGDFPAMGALARQSFLDTMSGARRIADPDQRAEALRGARQLVEDSMPAIPLFQVVELYGTRRGLKWQARSDQRILLADIAP
jgi:peptide/nickel transport system substrate-binding protein